jgi:outer membrane protein assembly factor BamE (lipoprotein component of BamABCDE complex)
MKKINILLAAICVFIPGCNPWIVNHGYNFDQVNLDKIQVNVDNKQKVQEMLGSPSSVSCFNKTQNVNDVWYYVGKKAKYVSVHNPDILEEQVVSITFDQQGIVRSIDSHKGEKNQKIEFCKDKTDTTGYESGALREVFGNFGRRYGGDKKKSQ